MTDKDLRDAAVAELKLTTAGWRKSNGSPNYPNGTAPPTTHWGKAMSYLEQIGQTAPPPPPPPTGNYGSALRSAFPESSGDVRSVSNASQLASELNAAQPGDIIRLLANITANVSPTRAGTAQNPITLESAPGQRFTISSAGGTPLRLQPSYWRIRRVAFTGQPGSGGGNVEVYAAHSELVEVESFGGKGQAFYTAEESNFCRLERVHAHLEGQPQGDRQHHGIYLQGDDHQVLGAYLHDFPYGFGIQVYDAGQRALIANVTVVRAAHSGLLAGGSGGVAGVIMVNNVSAHNGSLGIHPYSPCPTGWGDRNVLHGNRSGAWGSGCPGFVNRGSKTGNPFVSYPGDLKPAGDALGYADPDYCLPMLFDGSPRQSADCGAF